MNIEEGMILYHGSYTIVDNPDLQKCEKGRDFGKGFYLTGSRLQATKFVKPSIYKAIVSGVILPDTNVGYVSRFKVKSISDLNTYVFKSTDKEWLNCIVGHRKRNSIPNEVKKWQSYDVISGKIADDSTNIVLTAYMEGIYGQINSEEAISTAIKFLEPENLKEQYCFRSEKALFTLEYLDYGRVMI